MALPPAVIVVQTDNGSEFHQYFMNYLNEQKLHITGIILADHIDMAKS
ncbi:MAG: hypothetical protein KBB01_07775 [Candidatus Omnitrophica bacterium]|nr:hypothetical protein [Candidatus Omnitrophota bacterium]